MVKIDLIITGDTPGGVITALRLLTLDEAAAATPAGTDAPAVDPEAITTVPAGNWTDDHVIALWRFRTEDVRDIYRLIAHSSGHTTARDSLLDDVGITVRALSGRLASQDHALRRVRRPKCPERYISRFFRTRNAMVLSPLWLKTPQSCGSDARHSASPLC